MYVHEVKASIEFLAVRSVKESLGNPRALSIGDFLTNSKLLLNAGDKT